MEARDDRRVIAGRSIRWDDARARRAYAEGWWIRETLVEALGRAARETPDRVIVIDGELRLDCATLYRQSTVMAAALLARARPGDVVSFMLPNWHEAATVYLAATLAGMVVHPILPSLRERELVFMLADIDSRIIVVPGQWRGHDYPAMMRAVCEKLARPPEVVVLRGDAGAHTAYADLLREHPAVTLPEVDPDAVRMILYTSGTTGTPKGVMHTHNTIHALIRQLQRNWHIEVGDRFIVPSPISHIGGSIYAFEMPLLLGTSAVLMERWDPAATIDAVDAHACTHMAGATPFLEGMLASAQRKGTHLSTLKLFICGGASVPPTLVRTASRHFDRTAVTRVYGSTEVPVVTVGVPDRADVAHAAETDGRPGIATIKLVSHDGAASAAEGEILARGPQMLVGYLHAADEEGVFDAEGYYRTGDLGKWVDDAFLVISGRAKDIIIRNGENISPREVEDVLLEHPDVADASIVGIPDPATGERACAVVVLRAGTGKLDLPTIHTFLRAQGIATFKLPERLILRETLPRNTIGKVLKHEIRAELLALAGGH